MAGRARAGRCTRGAGDKGRVLKGLRHGKHWSGRTGSRTSGRTSRQRTGQRIGKGKGSLGLSRSSLRPLPAFKCIHFPSWLYNPTQPYGQSVSAYAACAHPVTLPAVVPPRPKTPGLDINAAIVTNMVYQQALMYPVPTFLPAIYRAPLSPGPGLVLANSSIFTLCTTLQAYVQYVQVNAPRSFTVRAGGGWSGEEVGGGGHGQYTLQAYVQYVLVNTHCSLMVSLVWLVWRGSVGGARGNLCCMWTCSVRRSARPAASW